MNAGGTGYQSRADELDAAIEEVKQKSNTSHPQSETDWEDIAVEFQQSFDPEGYDVTVLDNHGLMVKTHVYLHEWSSDVTRCINKKNADGLIEYLIGLNRTTEGLREGTIIRGGSTDG